MKYFCICPLFWFCLIFISFIGHSAGSDGGGSLEGIVSRLFSVSCEDDVQSYSEWTRCLWPTGDLRPLIVNFTRDAKNKGCKVPPPRLIKVALKALRNGPYKHHPLYKKIPRSECGFCGRKAQCCTKARSFLTQSFRSENCDESSSSSACTVDGLSGEEREALRLMYPDIESPSDPCDFAPFIAKELDKLRKSAAFKFVKPLLCQIIGTTKPSISCVNIGGRCHCCCLGFKYEAGECVEDPSFVSGHPDCY